MFYTSFPNSHAHIHVHKHAGPYRSCSGPCSKLNIPPPAPAPAISPQQSCLPTPPPASLCSAPLLHLLSICQKAPQEGFNLFIHFCVYLPSLFPYSRASFSSTAVRHCLLFPRAPQTHPHICSRSPSFPEMTAECDR